MLPQSQRFGGAKVGVHCHNDSGVGVAVSLAGIDAGATLVQGTMNGYGERVGNANLVTILPNLLLKMGRTAHCAPNLAQLRDIRCSSTSSRICGRTPKRPSWAIRPSRTKVGCMPMQRRKWLAATSISIPALVGNRTRVLVSDMAGRSSLALKAREMGLELDEKRPEMKGLIEELKEREFRGYEYEAADASFKLLVARSLGQKKSFFEVENYRVIIERHDGQLWSEATVKLKVNGVPVHTVAEESGPIGALDKALRLALGKAYPMLGEMVLRDYKVRILDANQGAGSRTRVLIESGDSHQIWGTVGVSDNIIDASWEALRESVEYQTHAVRLSSAARVSCGRNLPNFSWRGGKVMTA